MENDQKDFLPEGAIAFFTLLLLLGFLIWVGIYMLYIMRL